ncbi:hypothetical protein KEM56_007637 [Ascosphaera pollenicola]|nr:hypothetical protein KEM56_007637 [Ascosphaera pollenicola]
MPPNDRTPISVRRKRGKAQQEQRSQATARQQNKRKLQNLSAHLKRRRVEGGEASLPEIIKERKRKTSRLSGLETLPPELIEQIFLHCLECNLPFASPYIGAILSREVIYRLLIRVAFCRPPTACYDLFFYKKRPSPQVNLDRLGDEEIGSIQYGILKARWFTIERLMSVGDDIFRLYAKDQWFDRGVVMQPDDRAKLERWLHNGLRYTNDHLCEYFAGTIGDVEHRLRLWAHDEHSKIDVSVPHTDPNEPSLLTASISFPCPVLRFPEYRLRGPWSTQKVQFLKGLAPYTRVNGGASSQFTVSASALQNGIESAVDESNVEALEVLLTGYHKSRDIQPSYFLSAIHEPDGPELMKLLIRFCPLSMPHDDSEITQFAMAIRDQGDPFGDWLLDYMLHLPGDIAQNKPLFHHGRIMQYHNERVEQALKIFGPLKAQNPNSIEETDEVQEALS